MASCFTTCQCLALVGETVCIWSAPYNPASTLQVHVGSHGVRSKVEGRRDVARNVMCAAGVRGRDVFSATPDGCLEQ